MRILSIENFDGETCVVFLDICGFRDMMDTPGEAEKALDQFFNATYQEVDTSQERPYKIDCVAVSDCAIAFARPNTPILNNPKWIQRQSVVSLDGQRLNSILIFVGNVSRKMAHNDFAVKGSIAFGDFKFRRRIEIPGIDKAMFVGNAYLDAYRDVERGRPKLDVGEIRIKPRTKIQEILRDASSFEECSRVDLENGDYYYYWMLPSIGSKRDFKTDFRNQYRKRYAGRISILRKYVEMMP